VPENQLKVLDVPSLTSRVVLEMSAANSCLNKLQSIVLSRLGELYMA